jgi:hemerythrin
LTYTDVELLEVSQVLVPANPSALAKGMEKEEDLVVKEYSESVLKDIGEMFREGSADEFLDFIQKDLGDGVITKPETTEKYHHVPVPKEEGKHSDHKMRTITVSKDKGIKGVYCINCKKITSYMFSTDKWTMDEAKEWVEEHSKAYEFFSENDFFDFGDVTDSEGTVKDCICALYLPFVTAPESIKTLYKYIDIINKEIVEEGKKKPKPKPCKETEEEEMKEIVDEIKAYIDEKFKVLDEFMESYSETEEEFKKMLEKETEDLSKNLESKRAKEEEEDVSYIRTMIDEINSIAKKHVKEEIPVQSDETD